MASPLSNLPLLLLDGGMGTALSARGLDPGVDPTCTWNLTHPDVVRSIHEAFVNAGSDAITTNTFSANPWQLRSSEAELETALLEGVVLARAERRPGVLVIGNLGATGALPPPEGTADLNDLETWFETGAAILARGGADMIHIETLYHPKEARAALRGARRGAPEMMIVASMACRRVGGSYKTVLGLPWRAMLKAFVEEGADAVGANCSLSPEEMVPLIERMASRTDLPIWAQPTVAPDFGPPLYPGEFAMGLLELVHAGASAVGGCCGTSAADLAAARSALDSVPSPRPTQPTRPLGCSP